MTQSLAFLWDFSQKVEMTKINDTIIKLNSEKLKAKSEYKMQELLESYQSVSEEDVKIWFKSASIEDFPKDGGACVKYKNKQIAVFNFTRLNKWYACQNVCPHKIEMVLSRGMIGDKNGIPKVACPLHKKTFSLEDGSNLTGDDLKIATYPVKITDGNVYIGFSE